MIINNVDFLGAGGRRFESFRSDHLSKKGIVRWKPDYPFLELNGIAKVWFTEFHNCCATLRKCSRSACDLVIGWLLDDLIHCYFFKCTLLWNVLTKISMQYINFVVFQCDSKTESKACLACRWNNAGLLSVTGFWGAGCEWFCASGMARSCRK